MSTPTCARLLVGIVLLWINAAAAGESGRPWLGHDRARPLPPVVDPGTPSLPDRPGKPPSDAIVLFDGSDLSRWVALDGEPTKWIVRDGAFEPVPKSGDIRTLESLGDCQLHLEFATPAEPKGNSQGRGNSGVMLGMGRYEVQVLDSYQNKTYADGSAGAIYNQFPPLVNASRPPGEWQSYDILWTAPRFSPDGELKSPARLTVFHNGVVVQNNVTLRGDTPWIRPPSYRPHPEKLPLVLQDHGNPVRFRNVWFRDLSGGRTELYLPNALLDSYCGDYEGYKVTRRDGNLILNIEGTEVVLFAETRTHFFAKVVDIQADFDSAAQTLRVSIGEEGGKVRARK